MLITCRKSKKAPRKVEVELFKAATVCISTFNIRNAKEKKLSNKICYAFLNHSFHSPRRRGWQHQYFKEHAAPEKFEEVFSFLYNFYPTKLAKFPPILTVRGNKNISLKFYVPRSKARQMSLLSWLSLLRSGWEFLASNIEENSPAEIIRNTQLGGQHIHRIGFTHCPSYPELFRVLKAVKNNKYETLDMLADVTRRILRGEETND